jgi:hypothetical protein
MYLKKKKNDSKTHKKKNYRWTTIFNEFFDY